MTAPARKHVLVLSGVLAYQSIGFALVYAQSNNSQDAYAIPSRPSNSEPEDQGIKAAIDRNLSDLRSSDKQKRELAISRIHRDLPLAVGKKHRLPRMETSRKLSEELVNAYAHPPAKDPYSPVARRNIIQTIALYGDDEVAKTFILRLLEKGSADERGAALAVVGVLGVTGADIYDKIQDLAKRRIIKPEERTTLLVRVNKERALPEVLKEVASSRDKKLVLYSAWALQEYYRKPEYYSVILPRLRELDFGKPGTFKNTNGLFWMRADLFAQYVDSAQGTELQLALQFMLAHEEVRNPSSTPALVRKLKNDDPEIRIIAAQILAREAEWSQDESEKIKGPLREALEIEQDAVVKKSLNDSMAQIVKNDRAWRWTLEQMQH